MKQLFLSVIFLLIFCVSYAQKFRGGIVAGVVNTDVFGTDPVDNDVDLHKVGFMFGGLVHTPIKEKYAAQMEITFVQKGSYYPADSLNPMYYLLRLNYIEVPLTFKDHVHFTIRGKSINKFDLEGGLSLGVLISAYQENSLGAYPFVDPQYHKTETALHIGLSYLISNNFVFNIRYSNSLIPIREHNGGVTYRFNRGEYNTVFAYTFRYIF